MEDLKETFEKKKDIYLETPFFKSYLLKALFLSCFIGIIFISTIVVLYNLSILWFVYESPVTWYEVFRVFLAGLGVIIIITMGRTILNCYKKCCQIYNLMTDDLHTMAMMLSSLKAVRILKLGPNDIPGDLINDIMKKDPGDDEPPRGPDGNLLQ